MIALNAQIGAAISGNSPAGFSRELVTAYGKEQVWLHSFHPFAASNPAGSAFYMGLLLRPLRSERADAYNNDRLPAGPLDLYFEATQVFRHGQHWHGGHRSAGMTCTNGSVPFTSRIEWQLFHWRCHTDRSFFTDASNTRLDTAFSIGRYDSRPLPLRAILSLKFRPGPNRFHRRKLSASFWTSFGEDKPPVTQAELIAALQGPLALLDAGRSCREVEGHGGRRSRRPSKRWQPARNRLPIPITKLNGLTVNPAALKLSDWEKISPSSRSGLPAEAAQYRELYWVRARIKSAYQGEEPQPGA